MECTDSSVATAAGRAHNPPPEHSYSDYPAGFRFHPTDEELVVHYLKRKAQSLPLPASIIAEVDLYKFDPWELPAKAIFGEQEWYFFSPRDRKYPNGARPNRAATSGYWKATGTDKPVVSAGSKAKVGVKKALVFYGGKPPRGIKTNWIMHEYRLADNKASNKPPGYDHSHNKKGSLRLDDWVLCRIYKKNNNQRPMDQEREDSMEEQHMMMMGSLSNNLGSIQNPMMHTSMGHHLTKTPLNYTTLLETHEQQQQQQQQTTYFDHGLMDPSTSTMSLKRNLPSFWTTNDHDPSTVSPSKRVSLLSNDNNNDNNDHNSNMGQGSLRVNNDEENLSNNTTNSNSLASLLNQQSMLGNISDGGFRHPYTISGMNWYS